MVNTIGAGRLMCVVGRHRAFTAMNKRKEKLRAKIGAFIQQYARKAQRGQEPNDRGYSRAIEAKLKRMRPEELDELLNGEQDDPAAPPRPGPDTGQGPLRPGM
jgi:hypothetical protein